MTVTLQDMIAILVAFQGFLFAGFLWAHRGASPFNHGLLALFNLLLGLHFLNMFLIETGVVPFNLSACFAILYAPLLYLFVRSVIQPHHPLSGRDPWHALPLLLGIIWAVSDYRRRAAGLSPGNWITLPILLQMAVYLIFSIRYFRQYREIVVDTRSSIGMVRQRMLRFFLIMFALMMAGVFLEFWFSRFGLETLQNLTVIFIFTNVLALISGFMLMGLRNPGMFRSFAEEEVGVAREKRLKYQASTLSQADGDGYLARLRAYMADSEPYLEPNLKLEDLASRLDIPMRHLSQVINQRLGMNFFDFINGYRIEAVKAKMTADPEGDRTVLEMMLDAGFHSKSSFNAAFRKVTGTTPSRYRKKMCGSQKF